eukprot:GHVU01123204.1.p1 GENE.GHVU01123204.1~~GHVU01123204.1.p1  ORF type:complete len:364 (+),score=23.29 GHVU01123204.1:109-1092(+)
MATPMHEMQRGGNRQRHCDEMMNQARRRGAPPCTTRRQVCMYVRTYARSTRPGQQHLTVPFHCHRESHVGYGHNHTHHHHSARGVTTRRSEMDVNQVCRWGATSPSAGMRACVCPWGQIQRHTIRLGRLVNHHLDLSLQQQPPPSPSHARTHALHLPHEAPVGKEAIGGPKSPNGTKQQNHVSREHHSLTHVEDKIVAILPRDSKETTSNIIIISRGNHHLPPPPIIALASVGSWADRSEWLFSAPVPCSGSRGRSRRRWRRRRPVGAPMRSPIIRRRAPATLPPPLPGHYARPSSHRAHHRYARQRRRTPVAATTHSVPATHRGAT